MLYTHYCNVDLSAVLKIHLKYILVLFEIRFETIIIIVRPKTHFFHNRGVIITGLGKYYINEHVHSSINEHKYYRLADFCA